MDLLTTYHTSAKVQIDHRLRYSHTYIHAAHSKLPVDPSPAVIYSRFIEMCAWAYGTLSGCRPEMDRYLSKLPAVFVVIPVRYPLLLRVRIRARWRLKAYSRACLKACLIACLIAYLIACLRQPRFEQSRVFHGKLLADSKL
jgi:hypothetical protein